MSGNEFVPVGWLSSFWEGRQKLKMEELLPSTVYPFSLRWLFSYLITHFSYCRCCIDNTTGFYPQTRLFWGFRFQSFIFLGHNEVHIHCDAIVCRKEETHDDCDRSCLRPAAASGRRRRSVRHHIIQVDSGAIIVNDPRPPGPVIIRGGICKCAKIRSKWSIVQNRLYIKR